MHRRILHSRHGFLVWILVVIALAIAVPFTEAQEATPEVVNTPPMETSTPLPTETTVDPTVPPAIEKTSPTESIEESQEDEIQALFAVILLTINGSEAPVVPVASP